MSAPRTSVLKAVEAERIRQDVLVAEGRFAWTCAEAGVPDPEKLAVLIEEVGEVARAIQQVGLSGLQEELIQVAAVAVAWAEALTEMEP